MVKAVERDGFETVEEAGRGALGTIAKAGLAVAVVGAVVAVTFFSGAGVAAAAAGGWGTLSGLGAGLSAAGGAALTGGLIGGALATVGGYFAAPVVAGLGLLGFMKGAHKAEKENRAYTKAMAQNPNLEQARLAEAQNEALRKGFEAGQQQGFVAGGQHVIQQLQAAQAAQEQMMAAQAPQEPATNHAQKVGRPQMSAEDHAKHIIAQREAQQAAGAHLGA